MENEGVQFRCSTSIGVPDHPHGIWNDSERTIDVSELLRDFSVVVLAVGSETPRDLQVKGRDLKGIHFALEYLPVQNKHNASEPFDEDISAKDRKVLIIGGGDTGSDCLGTAIRQGAEKVLQIDLGPKPPETYDKSMVWPNSACNGFPASEQPGDGCVRRSNRHARQCPGGVRRKRCLPHECSEGLCSRRLPQRPELGGSRSG